MPLILRAIITGFGYKLGAEIGRYVATRIGLVDKAKARAEEVDEDLPEGIPLDPDDVQAENRASDDDESDGESGDAEPEA